MEVIQQQTDGFCFELIFYFKYLLQINRLSQVIDCFLGHIHIRKCV